MKEKDLFLATHNLMLDLVGKTNIPAVHGSAHKFIRWSLLSLIGPAAFFFFFFYRQLEKGGWGESRLQHDHEFFLLSTFFCVDGTLHILQADCGS
jgi:hypothetical protein